MNGDLTAIFLGTAVAGVTAVVATLVVNRRMYGRYETKPARERRPAENHGGGGAGGAGPAEFASALVHGKAIQMDAVNEALGNFAALHRMTAADKVRILVRLAEHFDPSGEAARAMKRGETPAAQPQATNEWYSVKQKAPPLDSQVRLWRAAMNADTISDGELHAHTDGDGNWMIGPELILRAINPGDVWQLAVGPDGTVPLMPAKERDAVVGDSGGVTVEAIARVCHEANRAYCYTIGDTSQKMWEEAPQWQRDSAVSGVEFHLADKTAGPMGSHDHWAAEKLADGWKYGPVKDADAKTHPCLMAFSDLPEHQQRKDWLFVMIVQALAPLLVGADGQGEPVAMPASVDTEPVDSDVVVRIVHPTMGLEKAAECASDIFGHMAGVCGQRDGVIRYRNVNGQSEAAIIRGFAYYGIKAEVGEPTAPPTPAAAAPTVNRPDQGVDVDEDAQQASPRVVVTDSLGNTY